MARLSLRAGASGPSQTVGRTRRLKTPPQLIACVTGLQRFKGVAFYLQADRDAPIEVVERFCFVTDPAQA